MYDTYVRQASRKLNNSIKLGKLRIKKAIHTIVLPNNLVESKYEQQ